MTFRKFVFWLHLLAGLSAGIVIFIMSFTGAALAFEKEIIGWAERDLRHVAPHAPDAARLPVDELLQRVRAAQPDTRPSAVVLSSDSNQAVAFMLGRDATIYVDPYSGDIRPSGAPRTRAFLRSMNSWHRWLALDGDNRNVGRAFTGACNAAFLFLAVSGLWLWWPRKWRTKGLKRSLVFIKAAGKARDWNWHNVIGFWSLPVLVVLTASGVVMSYRWANDLVYRAAGETPPVQGQGGPGGGGAGATPAIEIPAPAPGVRPLSSATLIASVQKNFPNWESLTLRLGGGGLGGRGGRGAGGASRVESARPEGTRAEEMRSESARAETSRGEAAPARAGPQQVTVSLKLPGTWPRTAATTLTLNPYTGDTLKTETFADSTPGRRARTWLRFLHTGEALGWGGQLIAGLSCVGACVLVYTGFALACHRFFIRPKELKKPA